ncbi:putative bifunctional diguanylate cyclase/phosphodiesterase [Janthinobacterium fluminis]|uniref:GGDEF domain-containing protein n=1 Tax=Janthinobacterium fluminis TaxID=2987524 RepID=A0ABT5K434_9BURK|nr:GGDEF domain-containing protein [Janthinobacterium fluminis]MDC8759766.1 GGDEF domain-containing protein [Janthinobacterium fluminis]
MFTPIFFLILAVSGIRYKLLIDAETANASARYHAEAQELGKYLASTLLPIAGERDHAAVQAILSSALPLNQDLALIRWDCPNKHMEIANPAAGRQRYPDWFGGLTGIGALRQSFPVALKPGGSGMLSLTFAPTLPTNRIWDAMLKQASISGVSILLIYLLLGLILSANRQMLRHLAQATDRFQHGDYDARMRVRGTPESRALATTFNNMAGEVQTLLTSLRASEKSLGDQLAQTVQMQSALQQMSWQNYHDVLTGLPNRTALAARFEQDLFLARERQRMLAVCLIDVDHFQGVNDRFGAESGDDILKQVAARLHAFANQTHYSARLGGDEFVMLLSGPGDTAAIERIVAQLLEELSQAYLCDGQKLALSVSVGVAVYAGKETSTETLLRHADHAVYQAKLTGRNKYHFFDAGLDEEVRTHHNQRTEIRQALLAGEFRLYYQPKVNMRAGDVVGMEALLRWQHPRRGVLGPLQFLPMVEQTDLIIDIGEWVLRQALWQMQRWTAAGRHWIVSVNIAARHFQQADFVSRLKAILAEFPGVRASMLELEILESSALDDIEHVRRVMRACQQLGITFALDDFGTGYSSMSYLKRLPANILKIDQSFVRNMLNDRDDLHLVGAVIGLAKSFKLTVIAEGVETVAHGSRLMQMGCDLAQGYGIARPMPADAVLKWAAAFAPAPEWRAAATLSAA